MKNDPESRKMSRLELLENILTSATDPGSLADRLVDIASALGVKHAAYLGVCVPKISKEEPHVMVTYPDEWVQRYKDQNYVVMDPVIRGAGQSMLPVDWRRLPKRTAKEKQLFIESRFYGLGNQGLTVPIRGRIGDYALFSVNSEATDEEWDLFLDQRLAEVFVLGTHIHQRVLEANNIEIESNPLSGREKDVLRWYAAGKETLDIAAILNLSPCTVRSYTENARHKLRALNRTHAVSLAQARGEIPAPM